MTKFFSFVDIPAVVQCDEDGHGRILLEASTDGVIDISGFRSVSILLGDTDAKSCEMLMGKIAGTTLARETRVPLDGAIHTFDVVGPEMALVIKGAKPNATAEVRLWVFLRT